MDLNSLSGAREEMAAWYVLREGFTEMLKSEKDEEDDSAPYVARALADEIVYG